MTSTKPTIHPLLQQVQSLTLEHPQRAAVIDKSGKTHSYSDLATYISHSRQMLQNKGVKKGTRVLVAVPMSMELYAILLALFSLGGIAVFLDPWMKGKQMADIIRKVKPEVLVISSRLRWLAWLLPTTWRIKRWWAVKAVQKHNIPWEIDPVSDEDIALITFTSGTSGMPKGADRSFGFLAAQMEALALHLQTGKVERDYTNFPIVGLADLGVGNTVVIPRMSLMKIHKADPQAIVQTMEESEASRMIVSPSLLKRAVSGFLEVNRPLGVHTVYTGGAAIPFSLIETCLQHFSDTYFEAIFGSTEAEPIAVTSFPEMRKRMADPLKGVCVGKPEAITHCRFIKAVYGPVDGEMLEDLACQEGEIGELLVTGDHVNKSYFENPQAFIENKVLDQAGQIWHRSGDMGYVENEQIYLVGRLHRIMQHEGRELHPFPMEFFLEREFGLEDVGYVQNSSSTCQLYIGSVETVDEQAIFTAFESCAYPLDEILPRREALPRDPRHRSKLVIKP